MKPLFHIKVLSIPNPLKTSFMQPFRWGIIGTGKIAKKFAEDLQSIEGAQIYAIGSTAQDRAEAFAKTYNAPLAFGSYEALAACPDIDAVYIATPHVFHCENTILCLNHRLPVLCEKPFAMNQQEVMRMIQAAKQYDTFLMEALWTRFLPHIQAIIQLIKADTIGKVRSVKADFGFVASHLPPESRIWNPALGGGSLLDIGIYPVYLALLLMGKPQKIKGFANFTNQGVDSMCNVLFQYKDGKSAILHSTLEATTATEAYIYGEKGSIHIHSRFHGKCEGFTVELYGGESTFHPYNYATHGYNFEAQEVMQLVRKGKKQSELMPLSMSKDLIATLDKIRKAVETRFIASNDKSHL
jgi:predicted dehydrogenase